MYRKRTHLWRSCWRLNRSPTIKAPVHVAHNSSAMLRGTKCDAIEPHCCSSAVPPHNKHPSIPSIPFYCRIHKFLSAIPPPSPEFIPITYQNRASLHTPFHHLAPSACRPPPYHVASIQSTNSPNFAIDHLSITTLYPQSTLRRSLSRNAVPYPTIQCKPNYTCFQGPLTSFPPFRARGALT